MKRLDDLSAWELLGLRPGAGREEIVHAYERLSALLAPGTLALYSVADQEQQRKLQRQLHGAYLQLLRACESAEAGRHASAPETPPRAAAAKPTDAVRTPAPPSAPSPSRPAPPLPPPPAIEAGTPITGAVFRAQRESRGLAVEDVARRTRIRQAFLEAIERDDAEPLPALVFTRGFIRTYACELGLDPDKAWASFEPRFLAVHPPVEPKIPE